jgi:L-aspartate oxidase
MDKRFPRIYQTCLKYNIDITSDLIPIRPAAHYAMGGVRTDLDRATNVPGLYAAGEVACTGVHGANRLASNSLLEGLVFGARAARAMCESGRAVQVRHDMSPNGSTVRGTADSSKKAEENIRCIQDIMWREVGIVRSSKSLKSAIRQLLDLAPVVDVQGCRRCCEARNIHATGLLIARSALAREESRGAHYRTDYPTHNDAKFLKHSVVAGDKITFEANEVASEAMRPS